LTRGFGFVCVFERFLTDLMDCELIYALLLNYSSFYGELVSRYFFDSSVLEFMLLYIVSNCRLGVVLSPLSETLERAIMGTFSDFIFFITLIFLGVLVYFSYGFCKKGFYSTWPATFSTI